MTNNGLSDRKADRLQSLSSPTPFRDVHSTGRPPLPEPAKLEFQEGQIVWIRRIDFNDGRQIQATVGKGVIIARGTSFCRILGKVEDESYSFNEWFPIKAKRQYLIPA